MDHMHMFELTAVSERHAQARDGQEIPVIEVSRDKVGIWVG